MKMEEKCRFCRSLAMMSITIFGVASQDFHHKDDRTTVSTFGRPTSPFDKNLTGNMMRQVLCT